MYIFWFPASRHFLVLLTIYVALFTLHLTNLSLYVRLSYHATTTSLLWTMLTVSGGFPPWLNFPHTVSTAS